MTVISRRTALGLLGSAAVMAQGQPVWAQGVEGRKFIFIFLRGAMDGLAALIPHDPLLEALRPGLMPDRGLLHDLGNGFGLHPALPFLKGLYDQKDAAFIHAAAAPYRNRSHFDAQDLFETMGRKETRDGWLNRIVRATGGEGLAVGRSLPLALQGDGRAFNWSPPVFGAAPEAVLDRLATLYEDDTLFLESLVTARNGLMSVGDEMTGRSVRRFGRNYRAILELTGRLMREPGGPGIGMVSLGGWDSHAGQARDLQNRFESLDLALAALKTELGPEWSNTCVVMCSEFGRTVAENGTSGTDHGTGGLVFLLGGAVAGGKVHGDWPGLSGPSLYENRDLAPANDITGILKGVFRDHMGIDRSVLDADVFPDATRPWDHLIVS